MRLGDVLPLRRATFLLQGGLMGARQKDDDSSVRPLSEPFHSKWDCKYHVVFIPKGDGRYYLQNSVPASGTLSVRWLGRKSAKFSKLSAAGMSGRERNLTGEHCWARRQAMSTIRIGVGANSPIYPRPRGRGWNRRTVLNS